MLKSNTPGIRFSKTLSLNYSNLETLSDSSGMYMICKKDNTGSNQVIFAGVATKLKTDLLDYAKKTGLLDGLSFCYILMSNQNNLSTPGHPLYQRVA